MTAGDKNSRNSVLTLMVNREGDFDTVTDVGLYRAVICGVNNFLVLRGCLDRCTGRVLRGYQCCSCSHLFVVGTVFALFSEGA